MNADLILTGGMGLAGGLAGYVWHTVQRDRPATPPAPADPKAEHFRAALAAALKSPPPGGVRVDLIASATGVSPESAAQVCLDLYARFAARVVDDAVITPKERRKLDSLASTLGIGPNRARRIEEEANLRVYEEELDAAHADGVVTVEEADHLARVRRSLGLSDALLSTLDDKDPTNNAESAEARASRGRRVWGGSVAGVVLALLVILIGRPAPPPAPATLAASVSTPAPVAAAAPAGEGPVVAASSLSPEPETTGAAADLDTGPPLDGQVANVAAPLASSPASVRTSTARPAAPRLAVPPAPALASNASAHNGGSGWGLDLSMPSYSTPRRSTSSGGSVSVRGYTRKDGTYVRPHTRSAPGSSARTSARSSPRSSGGSSRSRGRR